MKYAVTGGAGFIGSHIVEALIKNHEVIIIDNLSSGKAENIKELIRSKRVVFLEESITDFAVLKKAFSNVDGVFHQAAIASVAQSIRDPCATNAVNVTGTLNVLIAAKECGVKKVVFASSSSIYGDDPALPKSEYMLPTPKSPYAVSKLAGEYYMQVFAALYNLKTVCLRYFNVFGPRQDPNSEYAAVIPKFITRTLQNKPPIVYGDGEQTRDFVYVKDVVQANIRAMESDAKGIFNIAFGQRIAVNALARMIMESSGKTLPIIYEAPRIGDIQDSFADISFAKDQLHYSPMFTIKTGLEETIKWYKKQ